MTELLEKHTYLPDSAGAESLLLEQLSAARAAGLALVVTPQDLVLSTQEAADYLGVSRPTVVKAIESGVLRAVVPGKNRRKIKLADLLDYQERRREAQMQAIISTSTYGQVEEEDPAAVSEELRAVRAEVARRRRERAAV